MLLLIERAAFADADVSLLRQEGYAMPPLQTRYAMSCRVIIFMPRRYADADDAADDVDADTFRAAAARSLFSLRDMLICYFSSAFSLLFLFFAAAIASRACAPSRHADTPYVTRPQDSRDADTLCCHAATDLIFATLICLRCCHFDAREPLSMMPLPLPLRCRRRRCFDTTRYVMLLSPYADSYAADTIDCRHALLLFAASYATPSYAT